MPCFDRNDILAAYYWFGHVWQGYVPEGDKVQSYKQRAVNAGFTPSANFGAVSLSDNAWWIHAALERDLFERMPRGFSRRAI
jgi:hypothetical protein